MKAAARAGPMPLDFMMQRRGVSSLAVVCGLRSQAWRRARPRCARERLGWCAGFSLFEMILVLGILALLAGIVWPSLDSMYRDSQLRSAVDQVHARLAEARLKAMEEGVAYQFRYSLADRYYQITTSEGFARRDQLREQNGGLSAFRLPEGLAFYADRSQVVAAANGNKSAIGDGSAATYSNDPSTVDLDQVRSLQWSDAVFFRPDGMAENAAFVIATVEGGFSELRVRSLTGVVEVSSPQQVP